MPLRPAVWPRRRHHVLKRNGQHCTCTASFALGWANRNLTAVHRLQQSQKLVGIELESIHPISRPKEEFVSSTGRILPYPFRAAPCRTGRSLLGWAVLFPCSAAAGPGSTTAELRPAPVAGAVSLSPGVHGGSLVLQCQRQGE